MSKKPEILVDCPTCDRKNFTARGLTAHRCKGRVGAPSPSVELTVVDPADAALAEQLTTQYQRAVGGIREVLIFGAMMLQARDHVTVSTRGNGGKFGDAGTGLKGWLTTHAPKVNLSTAYRFMDLAEGLRDEFKLAKKCDLVHLLSAPVADLPPPQKKAREKIDSFVEGKSQRQLQFAFAHDTKAGKPKGGDRSEHRTGKRRTKAEVEEAMGAKMAAEQWALLRPDLGENWYNGRLFEHLEDGPLCNFVDLLGKLYDQARDLRDERGLKPATFVTEGWI